jgi:NRAMP (natural resistance-associated macrophage protein)-like metal ion transporter
MSDLQEIERHSHNPLVRYFRTLGPGLVTGAADDDPSGITTYSVAGASLGYGMLWMALATFPLMAAVQLVCARIGLVSGRGLAAAIRRHYPRPFLYVACLLLLIANVFNIAADLSGMAGVTHMLTGVPTVVSVPVLGFVILLATIYTSYATFAQWLKWLTAVLFAYIVTAVLARPDWHEVALATFVPRFRWDSLYMTTVVAVLGTTISPYLFFWQASHEVEAEKAKGRRTVAQRRGATSRPGCSSPISSCSSSSLRPVRRSTYPVKRRSRARARPRRRCGRWPATERTSCSRSG